MAPPAQSKWICGVDPGFTETGLVLRETFRPAFRPTAWATYTLNAAESRGMTPCSRAVSLAHAVETCLVNWIVQYSIVDLEVAIELPVYNGNAKTLMLQIRLLQEIEERLFNLDLKNLWLAEVHNTESKAAATGFGKAEKPAMVAASPFANSCMPMDTKEALADAWAHSLAGAGKGQAMSRLVVVQPKEIGHDGRSG